MARFSTVELHELSKKYAWWHSINLGGGFFTNGRKSPKRMEEENIGWQLPTDLSGKSVLDVGCADCGRSIIAMQRGACGVVSIDEQVTSGLQFLLNYQVFPLNFRKIDLFSNEFMLLPVFDVVIFAGVLYHVHDQLEALKRVRLKTRELAILETHINESLGTDVPYSIFYERDEADGDPTNWWGPNTPCLEAMIRTAGFQGRRVFIERTGNPSYFRVAYHLAPDPDALFTKVIQCETGSQGMLEEYRGTLIKYAARIAELEARLAAGSATQ